MYLCTYNYVFCVLLSDGVENINVFAIVILLKIYIQLCMIQSVEVQCHIWNVYNSDVFLTFLIRVPLIRISNNFSEMTIDSLGCEVSKKSDGT